jgi:DNA-directed RNA polymerase subunit N (RpoN/RPB10)
MPSIDNPPSGRSDRASELMVRVRSNLIELRTVDDAQLIEETIELAREAHALTTDNSNDRVGACILLACSLRQRSVRLEDNGLLLEETIVLEREALTACHEEHPDWATACGNLAISLWTCYERTGDADLLNEAIDLERKALSLRPAGHPDRSLSCGNLATLLWACYERTGDADHFDEAFDLERKALSLRPAGHPDRSLSCGNLASSLRTCYQRTGEVSLLDEAIDLQREALGLRPEGHPDRSSSFRNLATSLWICYERTGDTDLLDEAIDLERKALGLCPAGHPDRSSSCANLATSLKTLYHRTGDVGLLDEAVGLQREGLDLRPKGHPDRSSSCGNLALSLWIRYERTGDVVLLDEAMDLQHEALDLCPEEHPDRYWSCGNLATSLWTHYQRTGDVSLLDKAIDLQREAVSLCPTGHSRRYMCCGNLALSLKTRYQCLGDAGLLDEAIELEREVHNLCPPGHPYRSISCGNLARSLGMRTTDVALLHESLALLQEGMMIAPVHGRWIYFHYLTWTHLQHTSASYDVRKAVLYLSQSLEHDPDDIPMFVSSLSSLLDDLWKCNIDGEHIQLTSSYQRLVSLLPLLVHPALGLQPQLQALKRCTRLGSDAFVNAALADNWSVGLETLELAQGVIWSQSLHRRDPQLKEVPAHLASKLQDLLQFVTMGSAAQPDHEERKSLTPRDLLHVRSSHADAVIREIRALPGLDRFMLGETFETLRTAATNHPVVVLVGARGHYYALIMPSSIAQHAIISLELTADDERALSLTKGSLRLNRGGTADGSGVERTMKISGPSRVDAVDKQLMLLWNKVVQPILYQLHLKVSECDDIILWLS